MPILALDYGEKHVGLAMSDPEDRIALKYKTIIYQNQAQLMQELEQICQSEQITKIVIGLPKSLRGGDSPQTRQVLQFAKYVKMKLSRSVILEDERLTTKQAEKSGEKNLHEESARLILQTYLDKLNREKFR